MTWRDWYDALDKPTWTPEPSTIGTIWQILYLIILVTFGYVFYQVARKQIPWPVAVPFAINLIANIAFTPIQFGLRNLPLAAIIVTYNVRDFSHLDLVKHGWDVMTPLEFTTLYELEN